MMAYLPQEQEEPPEARSLPASPHSQISFGTQLSSAESSRHTSPGQLGKAAGRPSRPASASARKYVKHPKEQQQRRRRQQSKHFESFRESIAGKTVQQQYNDWMRYILDCKATGQVLTEEEFCQATQEVRRLVW